tara:strand:+ start:218 stop:658 length:441 start_codon:yes stop_codon:yes gene_type:complete
MKSGSTSFEYYEPNNTIRVFINNSQDLHDYVSYYLPQEMRTWSSDMSCWVILPDVVDKVVSIAEHYTDSITFINMPEHVRQIANTRKPFDTKSYSNLFLTPTAPKEVISAAYKALAKIYHPDNQETGSQEKFMDIKSSYDKLMSDD